MKTITLVFICYCIFLQAHSQTLITTSLDSRATANHNQRKIIRDAFENVYVVFTDFVNETSVIKGIKKDQVTGLWNNASYFFDGKNPTLSVSSEGKIHLIYESNDSLSRIMYTSTSDFSIWTSPVLLSDSSLMATLPVADADIDNRVNVFWIETNSNLTETLKYASVINDTVEQVRTITTKNEISDISVANHLENKNTDLYFALQFDSDSVCFFRSVDTMISFEVVFRAKGSSPCISYNSYFYFSSPEEDLVRFLYLDISSNIMEVEFSYLSSHGVVQLESNVNYLCTDDIAPPIGYSYLFNRDGILFHGFSFGSTAWSGWNTILDTIATNPINPSIAYKFFNFYNIDFVWMEDEGTHYNVYYKRDSKYLWLGDNDTETSKGFTIIGYPNPFSEHLTINVSLDKTGEKPEICIYDSNSRLINTLKPYSGLDHVFNFRWDGSNLKGDKVPAGIYIIVCKTGNITTARKVSFLSN